MIYQLGSAVATLFLLCTYGAVLLSAITDASSSSRERHRSHDSLHGRQRGDYRVILPAGRWKIRTSSELLVFSLGSMWKDLIIGPHDDCSISMCKGMVRVSEKQVCDSLCYTGKWREANTILKHAEAEFNRAVAKLSASISDMEALADTHLEEGYDNVAVDVMALSKLLQAKHRPADAVDVLQPYREMVRNVATKFSYGQKSESSGKIHLTDQLSYRIEDWRSEALQATAQYSLATNVLNGAQRTLATCSQGLVISDMTGCYPGLHGSPELFTDTPLMNVIHTDYEGVVIVVRRTRFTPTKLSRWYMAFTDVRTGNQTCWLERRMVTDGAVDYSEPLCNARGLCETPVRADRVAASCEPGEDMWLGSSCPVVCGEHCFGPLCYKPETGTYNLRSPPGLLPTPVSGLVPRSVHRPMCVNSTKILMSSELAAVAEQATKQADSVSHLVKRGVGTLDRLLELEKKTNAHVKRRTRENLSDGDMISEQRCESLLGRSGWMSIGSLAISLISCLVIAIWTAVSLSANKNPMLLRSKKRRAL